MQRLRKAAGLTAQHLGDRTEQLGLKMTRQAISDLENGRRRYVTTAELAILAAALNTSPVGLVYPGPYQTAVELLPGLELDNFSAAQWFSGIDHWPLPIEDIDDAQTLHAVSTWLDNMQELNLFRQLVVAVRARSQLVSLGEFERDQKQIAFYDGQIDSLKRQLGVDDA